MQRYFTLAEAEKMLPRVEEQLRKALHLKHEHEKTEEELQGMLHKVTIAGGMIVDRERLLALRARRDATAMRLKEVIDETQDWGVQIKDLDIGLIDFPTLFRGEEVLLCWKLGEDRIRFWHGLTEGFRGRKAIDDDFLANHRGEPAA